MMEYAMGWGMGWGWFGMILFWLVPLFVVIVLAAAAIKYLVGGGPRSRPESMPGRSDALAILEERYAHGGVPGKRDDLQKK